MHMVPPSFRVASGEPKKNSRYDHFRRAIALPIANCPTTNNRRQTNNDQPTEQLAHTNNEHKTNNKHKQTNNDFRVSTNDDRRTTTNRPNDPHNNLHTPTTNINQQTMTVVFLPMQFAKTDTMRRNCDMCTECSVCT